MAPWEFALGFLWLIVFLLSTTCHEAAHAWAALLGGDSTAARGGQVSLNPIPHIRREPVGTLVVPIASYFLAGFMIGWASAPYDPNWQERYPRRAAWMALAGPMANFALAGFAGVAIAFGISHGWFQANVVGSNILHPIISAPDAGMDGVAMFLNITFVLNLLLGVFNLFPVPPLDGATAIGLVLPEDTARRVTRWMRDPTVSIIGIVIAWTVFPDVFLPVLEVSTAWICS